VDWISEEASEGWEDREFCGRIDGSDRASDASALAACGTSPHSRSINMESRIEDMRRAVRFGFRRPPK